MDEEKHKIKERIIETATILFAEKGFDGLSMDELAREANVNKSMIYYYFSSKEGLLISIIQKHIAEFENMFNQIQIDKNSQIVDIVGQIITLGVEFMSRNKNIMTLLMHETMLKTPKTKVDIINFINPLWDKIEKSLKTNFRQIREISLIDKMLAISLIISHVLILNRIGSDEEEVAGKINHDFISRVTGIIVTLISAPENPGA